MKTDDEVPVPLAPFVEFCRDWDWRYQVDVERRRLVTGVVLDHCSCQITIGAPADATRVSIIVSVDSLVPASCRARVTEYLMRANAAWGLGHFEMDFATGSVVSKCVIPFEGGQISKKMARDAILGAAFLLDRYQPGLMRVIFSGAESEEEIRRTHLEAEQEQDSAGGAHSA